jgi:hypothetical protein
LPNDELYKIIVKKSIPDSNNFKEYIYERIDSITANVYRYCDKYALENNEFLIDSLKSEFEDTSKASRDDPWFAPNATTICWAAHMDSVLGVQLFIKNFYNITYKPFLSYTLGQNFGLIRYTYYGEVISVRKILKYAIRNGKKFGQKIATSVHQKDLNPLNFLLYQNYPNPFNSSTMIKYQLSSTGEVNLKIYDLLGKEVRTLVNQKQNSELHQVNWDGKNKYGDRVASGIYIFQLNYEYLSQIKRLLFVQ